MKSITHKQPNADNDVEFVMAGGNHVKTNGRLRRWVQYFHHRKTIWALERQDARVLQDLGIERYQITDYVLGGGEVESGLY